MIKEVEEKEAKASNAERRRYEKKLRAMQLTEDNAKLKQLLERQRMETEREEQEFLQRIAEEKERLRAI